MPPRVRTATEHYEAGAAGAQGKPAAAPTIMHVSGQNAVGARMFKYFADEDGYRKRFTGTVKSYKKANGPGEPALYRFVYSDGDKEDLTLGEARAFHRAALNPKKAKAAAKAAKKAKKPAKKAKKPAARKKKPAKKKAAKKKPAKKATGKRKRETKEQKAAANIKKLKKQLAAEEKKLASSKRKKK